MYFPIMPIVFKNFFLFLRCLFDNRFYVKQLILIFMVRYFVKFIFCDGSVLVARSSFDSYFLAEMYGRNVVKNRVSFGGSSVIDLVVGSASVVFD